MCEKSLLVYLFESDFSSLKNLTKHEFHFLRNDSILMTFLVEIHLRVFKLEKSDSKRYLSVVFFSKKLKNCKIGAFERSNQRGPSRYLTVNIYF